MPIPGAVSSRLFSCSNDGRQLIPRQTPERQRREQRSAGVVGQRRRTLQPAVGNRHIPIKLAQHQPGEVGHVQPQITPPDPLRRGADALWPKLQLVLLAFDQQAQVQGARQAGLRGADARTGRTAVAIASADPTAASCTPRRGRPHAADHSRRPRRKSRTTGTPAVREARRSAGRARWRRHSSGPIVRPPPAGDPAPSSTPRSAPPE